jgi:hypothetical protein
MFIHDLLHFLVGRNLENACRLLVFITHILSIWKVISSWLLLEVVIIGLVVDWSQAVVAAATTVLAYLLFENGQLRFKKLLILLLLNLLLSLILIRVDIVLLLLYVKAIQVQVFKWCLNHLRVTILWLRIFVSHSWYLMLWANLKLLWHVIVHHHYLLLRVNASSS